jgi:hypothetical protein
MKYLFTIVILMGFSFALNLEYFKDSNSFIEIDAAVGDLVMASVKTTSFEAVTFNNFVLDENTELSSESVEPEMIGDLLLYPQRFSRLTGTTFYYTLSKDLDIDLRLYNVRGIEIYRASYDAGFSGGLNGKNQVSFNEIIDTGVYHVLLINGGTVLGKLKMVVMP